MIKKYNKPKIQAKKVKVRLLSSRQRFNDSMNSLMDMSGALIASHKCSCDCSNTVECKCSG